MAIVTKKLEGSLPVSRQEFAEGATYYRNNIVTRYGSAFQCVVESTTTPPATIDESGRVMLGEGWTFFADTSAISNAVAEHTEKIVKIEQLLQEGYTFMGVATPETNPATPDQKVFYIANGKGTYNKFGCIEVTEDEVIILRYDTAWHKVTTGIERTSISQNILNIGGVAKAYIDGISDDAEFNPIVKELYIPKSIHDNISWIRVFNGFSGLYGVNIYNSSNQSICEIYTDQDTPYISNSLGCGVIGDWSKLRDAQYKDFYGLSIDRKVTSIEMCPGINIKYLGLTNSEELNDILKEIYISKSCVIDYLGVEKISVRKCNYSSSTSLYENGIIFYKGGRQVLVLSKTYPTLSDAQNALTKNPFTTNKGFLLVNWDKAKSGEKTYKAKFTREPSILDQKIIFTNKSLSTPQYSSIEHKFITTDGSIVGNGTTSDGAYTSQIPCKKGDKVIIFTYASAIMVVVSLVKNGNFVPKVIGSSESKCYEYICEEDAPIVISYSLSAGCDILIYPAGLWETYVMDRLDSTHVEDTPYYFNDAQISPDASKEHFVYDGDTKKSVNYIVNAVVYPNGDIIAARQGGSIVKIGLDGMETTLLTIAGASDWRGLFMDTKLNVYASPHNSVGSSGDFDMADRGLYKLAYGESAFTKVISLYNPSSTDTPETQSNDDTIWTMCEDADGYLYAGVYCHTKRYAPRIYRSTDGGDTWVDFYDFLEILPLGHHVHCVIYNEYNNALYAIIGEVNTILKSTNHGATWVNLGLACEGDKGTAMIAVPDGVIIGSDGAYELTMSKMNVDENKITPRGRVWANTCFGTRKSDVTGWIYAFGKIDSSVNSTSYMPPVAAISDASALQSWKDSSPVHLAKWEAYHNYTKDIYPDDSIRPQHFAILVSKDNGDSWEVAYREKVASTAANGIWCVGYFKNGECLCGRFINGQVQKPLIISEGKHKCSENGIDLNGEIFIRTNTNTYIA